MKQIFVLFTAAILLQSVTFAQSQRAPKCGMQQFHEAMIAKDPAWEQRLQDQKNARQVAADYYRKYQAQAADERTTSISAVPIIFHIIVDSAQFNALGGTAGIIKRCDSQIAVLNADYNHQNYDSTLIPAAWKDSLYGNVGIQFGLARKDPGGNCSPGYEVLIIAGSSTTDAGFSNVNDAFPEAKTAGTGLAAWDVTQYYNVWCINYTGSAEGLLGLTVPLSSTGTCGGCSPLDQEGVCILYNTLGSTGHTDAIPAGTGGSAGWDIEYDRGRTLTHETGHFFEIWHPWGDDNGRCAGWSQHAGDGNDTVGTSYCHSGTGQDDGLSDTPPESNAVYGAPAYTITGGTYNDCCEMHGTVNTQPIGIACLSYMDYTDDDAMHLFTPMQAAAMASMALVSTPGGTGATGSGNIGENYSLTQNPSLLVPCSTAGVAPSPTEVNSSLSVYPNPTIGSVIISVNSAAETLNEIVVINLLGQQVITVKGQGKDYYSIDLSAMGKGIYFVKCNFASGSVSRKILLQ